MIETIFLIVIITMQRRRSSAQPSASTAAVVNPFRSSSSSGGGISLLMRCRCLASASSIVVLQVLFLLLLGGGVDAHGYMIDPPSRSSVWRLFPGQAPPNYNDNELFCGGFSVNKILQCYYPITLSHFPPDCHHLFL